MSLFSNLNTANTALSAAQRAMEVAGQNVANVNTDGYSRQRVDLQSIGGSTTPAMWSVSNQVGSGVNSDNVTRIRDAFLEARAQNQHSDVASLTAQDDAYTQVQQAFREPGDTGLQSQLTSMWSGWSDIASNPTDPGARSQLMQRAQTLVAGLHSTMGTLDEQWSENHDSAQTLLTDVNATSASIADLNQSILNAQQSGLPTNDLQDKRDSLVLHLSEQIGATATQATDGTLTVSVGGITLVSGQTPIALALTGAHSAGDLAPTPPTPPATPPTIVTVPGNATVVPGGTAAGKLATMSTIIPGYEKQLNAIAQQLADQVNGAHESGYDLYGNPGKAFFDDGSGGTTAVTARNIAVAISDPKQLAAASVSPAAAGGTQSPDGSWTVVSSDSDNADKLYQLRLGNLQADGTYTDGADSTYRKMIVAMGVDASSVSNNLTTANAISGQVDASRESVSGVNIDEEMTNMLQFQHAYGAAGKLVSTIQSMMDDLMNMVQG